MTPTNHRGSRGWGGRRAADGFTLLELLLATAIAAIVLLVVNATFFAALRLHHTTHDRIDTNLVLERTLGIIRRDFGGLLLPPNPNATTNTLSGQLQTDSFTTNTMDGTGQRVTPDIFTSSGRIDGWTTFSDAQMVSYYLVPAADGGQTKDLVRVLTRNLLPVAEPETENQTLLTRVSSADIAYYDGSSWVDAWDSATTRTLPTAIKFTLVLAPRDDATAASTPAPVELIVPILVTTTTTAQEAVAAATP